MPGREIRRRPLDVSFLRTFAVAVCGSMVLAACSGSDVVLIEGGETSTGGTTSSGGAPSDVQETSCPSGQYVMETGTERQCAPCPEGSFSVAVDSKSCTPWSACPAGEEAPGTAQRNRVCHVDDWRLDLEGDYVATDIAAHENGDVVIVGHFGGAVGGAFTTDAFIRRYDAFGRELWTRQFGSDDADDATSVSTTPDGNSFVVGTTYGNLLSGVADALSGDGFIRKYDAAGNELWTRQFGDTADDQALSASTDPSGNLFVAISAYSNGDRGYVTKYDSVGNELWSRAVGTAGLSHVNGVAADSRGNVYVAGAEYTTDVNVEDLYLHKLDENGNELWVANYDGGSNDAGKAVAVDSEDNAIVFGETRLPEPEPWNRRGLLRKYSSDGALEWSVLMGDFVIGAGYYNYSVAVDQQDNVVVGTDAHYGNSMSALVATFGPDGSERWSQNFGSNGGAISGVCTDGRNDVLAVGSDDIQFVVRITQ